MKKAILLLFFSFIGYSLFAQPAYFSWSSRHRYNYISDAKDQREQGPCGSFATVAAVEAMIQIYFNTTGSELNLSESNLYSTCGITESSVGSAMSFFKFSGVVDDSSWPYPSSPINQTSPYYLRYQCDQFTSYSVKAKIPGWGESFGSNPSLPIGNAQDLKKAIMDHGPIIMMSNGTDQLGYRIGYSLHPGVQNNNVNHTVLVTGWNSTNDLLWEIKDSWPGAASTKRLVDIDFFNYDPYFYCIYPVKIENGTPQYISCKYESGIDAYSRAPAVDYDHDGFYRWGLDEYPPTGWTGYNKMDYDDSDPDTIFCDGYNPLSAPYISDTTSKYVCGSKPFTLNNFNRLSELGFTLQWNVTPANCFSSTTSGTTNTANVIPNSSYIGNNCKIEYQLKYNGNTIKTYKFNFTINGPREDLVSISVLDSYGNSAEKSGDFYYLCPNSSYTIYYNNNDYGCQTSNLDWIIPYGWTEYYHSSNYISINTNDYAYGCLQVYATTCCSSNINVKNVYFGDANCGDYFMAYPNPSNNSVVINTILSNLTEEVAKTSDLRTNGSSTNGECILTVVDKSGIIKSKKEFKGFPYTLDTSSFLEGLYFINLNYLGKRSTIRLVVKH